MSKSSFERWRGLLGEEMGAVADRGNACARAGFVDAGLIDVGGGAGRLELKLDLGGGVVLHLVRG
ncbi:hypothetical protein MXC99_00240 [Thauera aromatica]|nr:hypothetical protein [Thauera aromatica]MCK2086632.1 hypothetical protein [Thauera aromatica]